MYNDVFEIISHSTLATYEIRANETYRDIVQAMDLDLGSPLDKS